MLSYMINIVFIAHILFFCVFYTPSLGGAWGGFFGVSYSTPPPSEGLGEAFGESFFIFLKYHHKMGSVKAKAIKSLAGMEYHTPSSPQNKGST